MSRSDVNSALASGLQYTYDVLREIYEGETSVKKQVKTKKSEKKIEVKIDPDVDLVKQALERYVKRNMDNAQLQGEEFKIKNTSTLSILTEAKVEEEKGI